MERTTCCPSPCLRVPNVQYWRSALHLVSTLSHFKRIWCHKIHDLRLLPCMSVSFDSYSFSYESSTGAASHVVSTKLDATLSLKGRSKPKDDGHFWCRDNGNSTPHNDCTESGAQLDEWYPPEPRSRVGAQQLCRSVKNRDGGRVSCFDQHRPTTSAHKNIRHPPHPRFSGSFSVSNPLPYPPQRIYQRAGKPTDRMRAGY